MLSMLIPVNSPTFPPEITVADSYFRFDSKDYLILHLIVSSKTFYLPNTASLSNHVAFTIFVILVYFGDSMLTSIAAISEFNFA